MCHKLAIKDFSNANNKDRLVYIDSFQIYFLDQEGNPRTDIPNYVYDTLRISLEIEESYGTEVIILGLCKVSDGTMTRYDEFQTNGLIALYDGPNEDEIFNQVVLTKYDDYYQLNTAISSAGLSNETDPLVQARVLEKNPSANFANRFSPQRVNYINKYLKVNPNRSNITSIPSGQGKKVTFRLWLEGADPRCNSDISGSSIYMKLVFGSELAS
mgnify:CR=1 FL=1